MNNLKISFSKYDYFGIIIPGFTLLIFFAFTISITFYLNIANLIESFGNTGIIFLFFISTGIIIVSYVIGLIISGVSSWLIEGLIINKKLKFPSDHLFKESDIEKSYKYFNKYRKPYSAEFKKNLNQAFKNYFEESKYGNIDKFKLCFHVVKENCPIAFSRLTTFISLYGLYRNLIIVFFIGSLIYFYQFIVTPTLIIFLISISLILLVLFCFNNFLKYFKIYADEVFRSFYIFTLERNFNEKNEVS